MHSQTATLFALFALFALGCASSPELYDFDGDGSLDSEDCAPQDPARFPGAVDAYGNDIDENCDGLDGVDGDGDGWALYAPEALRDCNDSDATWYPGADDSVDASGADSNCDGVDGVDGDGDGFASTASGGGDCDDTDHSIHPGADESCDGIDVDCSFDAGEVDDDGDGYVECQPWVGTDLAILGDGDCEDANPLIHPGQWDLSDSTDLNCDDLIDGTGLSSADASFVGEGDEDESGISVSSAGDVDGDGKDDLLIGAFWNDDGGPDAGKTYLFFGSTVAVGTSPFDLSSADASFVGEDTDDLSGSSVSSAGDVDGDGKDDLLIGAPQHDGGRANAGKTYLFFGSTVALGGSFDLSAADASFVGESASDHSGYSVASAGDIDGDGLDDLLIGAYENDEGGSDAGKTYLFLGSTVAARGSFDLSAADASFVGESASDHSGYSVASAGDIDGDGLDDLLIGSHGNGDGGINAGKTYLFFGSTVAAGGSFDLSDADFSFVGENANDWSGYSVSSAGDVNGDGNDDLLIGAYRYGDPQIEPRVGKTYLFLGSTVAESILVGFSSSNLSDADYSFVGENADDYGGYSVSSAGDVDGDGLDDLLIGSHGNDEGGSKAGKTHLFFGSTVVAGGSSGSSSFDLSSADYSFVGENDAEKSGYSVSSAGDVDGDGKDDLLIGARGNDEGGSQAGKTYLLLSPY